MDEPLFGERQQKTQVVFYISASAVSIFVAFSIVVAVIFGIGKIQHFFLAASLGCLFAVLVILCKWYRAGDLDPKTKYLIFFLVFVVLLTAASLNAYVWEKKPTPPPVITCNGLYRFSDATCFPNIATCTGPGACVVIEGKFGHCEPIPTCNTTSTSTSHKTGTTTSGHRAEQAEPYDARKKGGHGYS